MMNEAKMAELNQAKDMAYFRADLCCYSPKCYSLEDKKEIRNDKMSTSKTVLDAMREDFEPALVLAKLQFAGDGDPPYRELEPLSYEKATQKNAKVPDRHGWAPFQ